jgi:hypothetical protein
MNRIALAAYRVLNFLQGPSRYEFWLIERWKSRIQDFLANEEGCA